MPGFGNAPYGYGPAGTAIPGPALEPEENLNILRSKLCLPGVIRENKFIFTNANSNQKLRVDGGQSVINQIAVTVTAGTIDVHIGEADMQSTLPAFQFTAGDTIFVTLPPHEYVFTILPNGVGASGNFVTMAV